MKIITKYHYYHDYRQINSQFVLLYEDIVPLEYQSFLINL